MAEIKTKATEQDVGEFLAGLPNAARAADARVVIAIMQKITGEAPKMWGPSIIGFGSQRYRYASGREGDWPVAAFSPRKPALVLYGLTGAGSEELLARLGKHMVAGGCLHIKKLAAVDLAVLEELIRKAV